MSGAADGRDREDGQDADEEPVGSHAATVRPASNGSLRRDQRLANGRARRSLGGTGTTCRAVAERRRLRSEAPRHETEARKRERETARRAKRGGVDPCADESLGRRVGVQLLNQRQEMARLPVRVTNDQVGGAPPDLEWNAGVGDRSGLGDCAARGVLARCSGGRPPSSRRASVCRPSPIVPLQMRRQTALQPSCGKLRYWSPKSETPSNEAAPARSRG